MARTLTVTVSPVALKWARENGSFTKEKVLEHFAKSSKRIFRLTPQLLDDIEQKSIPIRARLLKELSKLYEQPLAVFFLEDAPAKEKKPTDERTQGNGRRRGPLSPDAMSVLKTARRVQLAARELKEELKESYEFKLGRYTLRSNPIQLAADFRNQIGLTHEKQTDFPKDDVFFAWIRAQIEATGVFVLKEPFPIDDALGFSLTDEQPFVIVVNSKWGGRSYAPKIFSLLHEYAHILLRHGGICNDFSYTRDGVEAFCNKFAANVLIPATAFDNEFAKITDRFVLDDIDDYIEKLTAIFKASRPALLLRFREKGLVSQAFYEEKRKAWEEEYGARDTKDIPFRVFQDTRAVNSKGKAFADLVVRAVAEQRITRDSAADFLDIQPTYLLKVAKRVKAHL